MPAVAEKPVLGLDRQVPSPESTGFVRPALTRLGPNEWAIMPAGQVFPTERSYGIGNPMGMIMQEAAKAGEEAHRIWNKGIPDTEPLLDPYKELTSKETAIRNTFAFLQVSGKAAGGEHVTNRTTGLTWDRQNPVEDMAKDIVGGIGGEKVQYVWFGPHKLVGFVKGVQTPESMMQKMNDVPRKAFEDHLPHLAKVQNMIQDERQADVEEGNGKKFVDHFYGKDSSVDRAYQDDGRLSFEWLYADRGGQLWGIDLDNMPMSVTTMALDEHTDEDTRNMLLTMQEFFTGDSTENRYMIQFNFGPDVACCNISYNAQQDSAWGPDYIWDAKKNLLDLNLPKGVLMFRDSILEETYACKQCKGKEKCVCKAASEEQAASE